MTHRKNRQNTKLTTKNQIWLTNDADTTLRGFYLSTDRPEPMEEERFGYFYEADVEYYVSRKAVENLLGIDLNIDKKHRARINVEVTLEVFDENMNEQILT